jgi:ATP-dependent Clp protease adaptor protein ClpS
MSADSILDDVVVTTRPKQQEECSTRRVPPYHVIVENDDYHDFMWVVGVLSKALGYSQDHALRLTMEIHCAGRSPVWTGPKEVAELKADQVRTFHEIRAGGRSLGPIRCHIEPAPGG